MSVYELHWTRRAEKVFSKLDKDTQERVKNGFKQLIDFYNGQADKMPDVKRLKGKYRGLLRLRIGDHRVIFKVERERFVILVIDIVSRGNAYKS